MTWNPNMDEAPRDFSSALIFQEDSGRNNDVGEAYFAPSDYEGDDQWHWVGDDTIAQPTHWMPLPAPPQRKG